MTDPWAEKPDYTVRENMSYVNMPFYLKREIDPWLERLKVEYDLLKEHSGRWLHFVAVDYPEIKESSSPQKLMELKEKAEKFDLLMKIIKEFEYPNPFLRGDHNDWLDRLRKILEGEQTSGE